MALKTFLSITIILGGCLTIIGTGMTLYFGNFIKKECARKIADHSLTEPEKEICRSHGHL